MIHEESNHKAQCATMESFEESNEPHSTQGYDMQMLPGPYQEAFFCAPSELRENQQVHFKDDFHKRVPNFPSYMNSILEDHA